MHIPAALINHMRGRETGGEERNVERGRGGGKRRRNRDNMKLRGIGGSKGKKRN